MNPFTEEVTCDVCGGDGVATMQDSCSRWVGGRIRHRDPQVCADNLYREREADKRRKKELESKVSNLLSMLNPE